MWARSSTRWPTKARLKGAFMQGFGQALIEEMQTQDGRVSTLSLGDYKLPTENDLPDLVTVHVSEGSLRPPFPTKARASAKRPSEG